MVTKLKVLTLNCWGVFVSYLTEMKDERFDAISKTLANADYDIVLLQEIELSEACQLDLKDAIFMDVFGAMPVRGGPWEVTNRHVRYDAICKTLSDADYDIVLLQEVWTQKDYQKLHDRISPTMPESHYFHSGVFGSGLCIFSRHPILETFLHRYTLNGYFHKIWHGDFHGGKGIGLAKVRVNGIIVNVYTTHMHAQYDNEKDEYLAHRVSQSYEMAQFVKMTSRSCDVVILGGDLNLQPSDLGYKLLMSNTNLQDSWLTQESKPEDETGNTCDRPDNMFHCKHTHTYAPQGLRLDYLLYKANRGWEVKCDKCYLTMRQIPGGKFPYSDHEGVAATYTIKENTEAEEPKRDSGAIEKYFSEALPIIDAGQQKVRTDQVYFAVVAFLCFILLVFSADVTPPWGLGMPLAFVRVILTIIIGYLFWMGIVLSNFELNGLLATRKDINNILKVNPHF